MKRFQILGVIALAAAVLSLGIYMVAQRMSVNVSVPTISMKEDTIDVSVEAEDKELLEGITATDKEDGDVTDSLIVESKDNIIGKLHPRRLITVVAFDSDNNATKAERTVRYTDYHEPTFSLEQPMRFPMGTTDILSGIGAKDVFDGDITGRIKVSDEYTVDTERAGTYPMVFTVANTAGDVSKLKLNVEIYDPSEENGKPQIELRKGLVNLSVGDDFDPWRYVKKIVVDNRTFVRKKDGILYCKQPATEEQKTMLTSEDVYIKNKVKNNKAGQYEVTYSITSESGLTGTARLIVVVHD